MIRVAVGELAHHPHVRIRLRAVLLDLAQILISVEVPVKLYAVVNVQPLGLNAGRA